MNKRKLWPLIVLAAIMVGIIVILVRPDTTQEIAINTEATESADIIAIPSETVKSDETISIDSTETSVTETTETTGTMETEPNQKQEQETTKDPYLETNVQPEGDETLPSDVDVSMGVEKDAETGVLDDGDFDTSGGSAQSQKPVETKPKETTPPASSSTGSSTNPLSDNYDITSLTYEGYMAMTGEQQQAVIDWFASPDVFVRWFNAVEAQYKAEHPDIEIGADGVVDLS